MSQLKILIVEDEMVVADHLATILERLGYEVLPPAINYTEAIAILKAERPDLAFLDIQLAGSKDGIDLAKRIKEEYHIPFIFLTSNADPKTVGRAKLVNPSAFLVKPFNRDDIFPSIEMALFNFPAGAESVTAGDAAQESERASEEAVPNEKPSLIKDVLFVKNKNLFQKVKLADIVYLKAEHVYVEVHLADERKYLIRKGLTQLTASLPEQFFRTHRSYTINLDHLEAVNSLYILAGPHKIPIGKNYREELLNQLPIE